MDLLWHWLVKFYKSWFRDREPTLSRAQTMRKFLIDELLRRPLPDLMIQIIGENYDFARNSFQASIDQAFRYVMREIMEETSMFRYAPNLWRCDMSINRYLALEW